MSSSATSTSELLKADLLELHERPSLHCPALAGDADPVYCLRLASNHGEGLKLPVYPLKNARHHWAVRMVRGGAPVRVVQAQLGLSTAKLTLDTYGRWLPGSEDRARAEAQVTRSEVADTSNHTSTEGPREQGRELSSIAATVAG